MSQLQQSRKQKNLVDLKKLESSIGTLKNAEQRLIERENSILRMNQKDQTPKTFSEIAHQRRQDLVKMNTSKFGEQTIGIHG
jgi:hypothetical protein